MAESNDRKAWEEVHSTLLKACELAQDSLNAQKMQYRFWLEEITANLTTDGHLTPTSVWTHPKRPNLNSKRKPPVVASGKRKRKSTESTASTKKTAERLSMDSPGADGESHEGNVRQHKPKKIKISFKHSKLDKGPEKAKNKELTGLENTEDSYHRSSAPSKATATSGANLSHFSKTGDYNSNPGSSSGFGAPPQQHQHASAYDAHASAVYNSMVPGQPNSATALQLPLHRVATNERMSPQHAAYQHHLQQHQHLSSLTMNPPQAQNPLQIMVRVIWLSFGPAASLVVFVGSSKCFHPRMTHTRTI